MTSLGRREAPKPDFDLYSLSDCSPRISNLYEMEINKLAIRHELPGHPLCPACMHRKTVHSTLANCCRQSTGITQRSSLLPRRLQTIRPRCFSTQRFTSCCTPAVQYFRRISFSSPPSTITVESTYRANARRSPMATARKIELSTSNSCIYSTGVREDAARAASQVLQENLEKHHIYFNDSGFHSKFDWIPRIYRSRKQIKC